MNLLKWFQGKEEEKKATVNAERLIPFILKWEAGVKRKSGESLYDLFERARYSGWADDPDDMGGATMCGITLKTYKAHCRKKGFLTPTKTDLRQIGFNTWKAIFKNMYWDKWQADQINDQKVANFLVDWVWASGNPGIKIPQQLLGVKDDGIVGPKTLEALNRQDPEEFLLRLYARRVEYYKRLVAKKPSQNKFLKGWMNRLNDIMKYEG